MQQVDEIGLASYLSQQLHPSSQVESRLPPEIQAQLAALTITQRSPEDLLSEVEERRKNDLASAVSDDEKKPCNKRISAI